MLKKYINTKKSIIATILSIIGISLAFIYLLASIYSADIIGEYILSAISLIFNISMLSTLKNKKTTVEIKTSIIYASLLFTKSVCYFLLDLHLPLVMSLVGAVEWCFLAIYRNNINY